MSEVFLGGTCNESTWRDQMKGFLDDVGLDYFDPVVEDWDEKAQARELEERRVCDFCLYTITPKKSGDYAIAEAVDDSNKRPEKTVLVLLRDDGVSHFDHGQWRSLMAVARMVRSNRAQVFESLGEAALYMGEQR